MPSIMSSGVKTGMAGIDGDRQQIVARDPVAPPRGPGGDRHMLEAETQDVLGGEPRVAIDIHVGHLARSGPRGSRAPGPRRKARAGGTRAPRGRQVRCPPRPAPPRSREDPRVRRRKAGRPGADHQHAGVGFLRRHALGMPALAPFLHEGGVLRAAAERHGHVAGHADVAADAFADVLDAVLVDLLRQEGIGNGRPRRADEVEDALLHLAHHHVGRGEAADAHHRLRRQLLDAADQVFLRAFRLEARGAGTGFPGAMGEIPEIGQARHAWRRGRGAPHW